MFDIEIEILSVLNQNGEMYGLEIIDTLNQKLGKNWLGWNRVGFGNLYPALRRLERKEAIVSRWAELDEMTQEERVVRGHARKRYYKIALNFSDNIDRLTGSILASRNSKSLNLALKGKCFCGIAFILELTYLSLFEIILFSTSLVIVGLPILLSILVSTKLDPFATFPLKSRIAPGALMGFGFGVVCLGLCRLESVTLFLQNAGAISRPILPPLPEPLAYVAIATAITGLVYIWRYNSDILPTLTLRV
ncbi:hypothetical protein C7B80_33675 [Cyanosarcina cf. burmensis CCALA 770]|nr:hypothetical protein C7B80_33675 [Cyanosarcina cf. burmensis CCALA 770]